MLSITQLWLYPIKSCQGIAVDEATLLASGLAHDREMMIVDADGRFVTQRSDAVLATIAVRLAGEQVILSQGTEAIAFERQYTTPTAAVVWSRRVPAFDQGDTVAAFLSHVVGRPVRLLATRPADTLTAERQILFQDGRAVHVLTEASLEHAKQHLSDYAIDARRFRPNVVIGKADSTDNGDNHDSIDVAQPYAPFCEDQWQHLATDNTAIAVEKYCERCNIPAINPDNLAVEQAVQNYLMQHRLIDGKPMFGVCGRGVKMGRLRLGGKVRATLSPH